MSNANPASVLAPVILAPGMTAVEMMPLLATGRTDVDAIASFARDGHIDLRNVDEYNALNTMLPAAAMREVFIACIEREKKSTKAAAAVRVSFSEAGRAVLNNSLKMNQSKDGRGGVSLCLYPRELSQLLDHLPVLIAAVVNNADAKVSADAKKIEETEEDKAARKASGAKFDRKQANERKHLRAGLDCMDWTGTDKNATIAKLRVWLERNPLIGEPKIAAK